jgi:hypothetical protein
MTMLRAPLEALLSSLADHPASDTVANPYRGPAGPARLRNLRCYLTLVADWGSTMALVGEAPGYRGCAVTGVPLTSRVVLASDVGRWGLFSPAGFVDGDLLGAWQTEVTATTVWRLAPRLFSAPPLLANAFPFHPHPPGRPHANRALLAQELVEGAGYLRALFNCFPGIQAIAVGRRAEQALRLAGVAPVAALRHPAHGGAAAFTAGLCHAVADLGGTGRTG